MYVYKCLSVATKRTNRIRSGEKSFIGRPRGQLVGKSLVSSSLQQQQQLIPRKRTCCLCCPSNPSTTTIKMRMVDINTTLSMTILVATLGTVHNQSATPRFATPCTTPNGEIALCLELFQCPLFGGKAVTPGHPLYRFYSSSFCGPSSAKYPRVCCGKYEHFLNETNQLIPDEVDDFIDPLPEKCGKHKVNILASRIFGGNEATLGEFPWMVRLRHRSRTGSTYYGCSGFLIHKKFVLTAAHCVANKDLIATIGPVYQIIFGEHDSSTDVDCDRGLCADRTIRILAGSPVVYSGYNNDYNNHNNDLALIPLKEQINFSDYIQPLCITKQSQTEELLWVSGWGKTETQAESSVKLKVELPRYPFKPCYEKYNTINVLLKEKNHICAGGESGKDSCSGDSGGPLMVYVNNRWYAEGIVSFGTGCGKGGWPGVYTNLPTYLPWIQKTIQRKLNKQKNRKRELNYY
ncbi:PREDICTED: serine protease easter-like [Nicrophorus vespilloides]|uniref:CLIP domain-containing serine protease n=1 Tax=Nicrophorus vespilloides TaxID=110193 RepID=A0ABM1M904_NICVS|nr:PREDICTED: serine protease easter-like [Nicrophorus vespilloides]